MTVNFSTVRALTLDVTGVVDRRGSIAREARKLAASRGLDGPAFARAWRAGCRPAMDRVRQGNFRDCTSINCTG